MYILPRNIQTRQLRGTYTSSSFPLPTDSLARAAAAPAAAASIAKAASARRSLRGGYVPADWTTPPYRSAGMGLTFAEAQTWAMAPNAFLPQVNNLIVYGGGALALYFLMGKRGRR